jgi:transposase InsO family protein
VELIARTRWRTRAEARRDVFAFIETRYNRERRHSTLGYRSPATYEREVLHAAA